MLEVLNITQTTGSKANDRSPRRAGDTLEEEEVEEEEEEVVVKKDEEEEEVEE